MLGACDAHKTELNKTLLLCMVNRSNFCTSISENEQMVSISILCYNK
jgi:hypothetical protein